jgi:hypothetical protein
MRTRTRRLLAIGIGLLAASSAPAGAAILDGTNTCDVKLDADGGADVRLIGEFISAITGRAPSPRASNSAIRATTGLGGRARQVDFTKLRKAGADVPKDARDQAIDALTERMQQFAAPGFKEHRKSNRFYYLPAQQSIRVATDSDGTPKFLLVNYTTEERADAGGTQGGLLHMLMEWSLTSAQEAELRDKVKTQCKVDGVAGELVGAVELGEGGGEKGSFRIISAILADDSLRRSMVQSGHAPTMPGGQVAVAANLSKNGAQLFRATLEQSRSIADLSVELDYEYAVMMPAARGEIVFHWDRLQEMRDTRHLETHDTTRRIRGRCMDALCLFRTTGTSSRTFRQEEVQGIFQSLVENNVVQMNFEGYQTDPEFTAAIMQAMLKTFTDNLLKPADESSEPTAEDEEGEAAPGPTAARPRKSTARNQHFIVDYDRMEQSFAAKKQVIRLDAGLVVPRDLNLVGNLADFYDAVKNNPKCIQSVNLNDPFFEHREVRFILDLDARDVFEDMANYVTVNVRKRRSTGNDFERSLTIDQKHLKERGVQASLTYARESDQNSDVYEYQTQWSMRGGHLIPPSPRYLKGNWEGVTLATPIERWRVEVEGDLDQMTASGIARMQVEIHYPLFGQEEARVISLSPRAGQWLVGENIYVDRGTKGFAYRLILHHKTDGRLALPWQKRIGDRYVYATIPEEYLVVGAVREAAKQAALEITELGKEKVLDKMRDLFSDAD